MNRYQLFFIVSLAIIIELFLIIFVPRLGIIFGVSLGVSALIILCMAIYIYLGHIGEYHGG